MNIFTRDLGLNCMESDLLDENIGTRQLTILFVVDMMFLWRVATKFAIESLKISSCDVPVIGFSIRLSN